MWPLNIRLRPPPSPGRVPTTFGRSRSTSCHVTVSAISSKSARMCSAIASS
jgi:hypothetical protein